MNVPRPSRIVKGKVTFWPIVQTFACIADFYCKDDC